MSDKVSICNAALNALGANSIISIDDTTVEARRCAGIYDQARKALLREHPWSCAIKRSRLAPTVSKPVWGWANAFPLPADFVRLLAVNATDFAIESRHVLANADVLQIKYIFDNDSEQTWDDLLVEAMTLKLMHKLAKPITGSSTEGDSAYQELQILLKRARAINGQEYPSQDFGEPSNGLIEVRY